MKYLLIPFAFVACNAMACPGDGAKNAMAPAAGKSVAAAKSAPTSARVAATPAAKNVTKVAAKPATEPRKSAPL